MVITSQDVSIPAAANPFTALLVCGQARAAGETDDGSDEEQERFLKAAEPARHNKWTRTEKLGEVYKPGYMDALKKIQKLVRDKILDLVACERAGGREGPQLLRAKFPLGLDGGGGREQPISLSRPCAEVAEGGAWRFSGSVRRNRPAGGNWKVRVKLRFAQDGGGRNNDDTGLIKALTTTAGTVRLSPEGAEVTVPPDTDSFDFSGESDVERHPVSSRDSVISVEVSGQVGADGQED